MKTKPHLRKHHYIYKITRQDGAYYIGMHSTDDLEDGYFGSGKRLRNSIIKHGKNNHKLEILHLLDSRELILEKEKELITKEVLKDPLCLNLQIGGAGYLYKSPDSEIGRINKSEAIKAFYSSGSPQALAAKEKIKVANLNREYTEEMRLKSSISAKARMKRMQEDGSWELVKQKNAETHTGKKHSEETNIKRNLSISKYKEQNGGKRTFSEQAKLNISNGQIGGPGRNIKTWELIDLNGNIMHIKNLEKWVKENGFKIGAVNITLNKKKVYSFKRIDIKE